MIQTKFQPPDINNYLRLRQIAGLSSRSPNAAEAGLPNSLFAVTLFDNDLPIGMGRIVGDGGLNFEIVDIAVDPKYQGKGYGRLIMTHIMEFLHDKAPEGCYISLIADVPALYEKFGFKKCSPSSEGMYLRK